MERTVWRRRALREHSGRAVSPVVATLILILIAVAAAAALYLWLVAWQGGVTGSIGSPGAQATLTVGGSTSAYPFLEAAASQFQQNNTDVAVSVNGGGSSAGLLAVCHGSIEIGAASTPETASELQTSDGCPATTVVTTVAYDAVDLVTDSAANSPTTVGTGTNSGPLLAINNTVLTAIYVDGSTSSTPTLSVSAGAKAWLGTLWTPGTPANWDQIPTTAGCGTTGYATLQLALAAGLTAGGCNAVNLNHQITTVSRSDAAGATQAFEARLLGATSSTAEATTYSALGYSGCGSNNLLADCGIATTTSGAGDSGVLSIVASNPDAIGYLSDGIARGTTSVVISPFAAPGQTQAFLASFPASQVSNGGVIPTTGSTGTIAAAITGSTSVANYAGWRPFVLVTTNTPTGEVEDFINWILDPANNQNIATETHEVSLYSV